MLADLQLFCNVFDTTYRPGADALEMATLEGRRQVYIHIANILNTGVDEAGERKGKDNADRRDEPRPERAGE